MVAGEARGGDVAATSELRARIVGVGGAEERWIEPAAGDRIARAGVTGITGSGQGLEASTVTVVGFDTVGRVLHEHGTSVERAELVRGVGRNTELIGVAGGRVGGPDTSDERWKAHGKLAQLVVTPWSRARRAAASSPRHPSSAHASYA